MIKTRCYLTLLLSAMSLAACGGSSGGDNGTPPVTPPLTPPPSVVNITALEERLDDLNVTDYAVVIGDANGVLLSREFGNFSMSESYFIASATKWLAAMVIMDLVEQGVMSLDDRPQDYMSWWTTDAADARSGA